MKLFSTLLFVDPLSITLHFYFFKGQMVDQNKRTEDIGEPYDIEGWTKFDFPQRNGKYSDFKWNYTHFTGVDYDAKGEQNGIWRIVGDNKYWSKEVDKENAK